MRSGIQAIVWGIIGAVSLFCAGILVLALLNKILN